MAIKIEKLKLYSFFSGAGFLDLGFESEDYDVVFVNEFNKSFLDAYKYARKKMKLKEPIHGYYQGDINDLLIGEKAEELCEQIVCDKLDSYVGFIGGPPCPDFSVAGKNKGADGDNGKLSNSYKNIILKYYPDFFVFENVKGLWATKKHREFYDKLKKDFEKNGYFLVDKLVNSLEYGVPQDRERIILFGIKKRILKESSKTQTYIHEEFDWGNRLEYNANEIKRLNWPTTNEFFEDNLINCPEGIIENLTIQYWFEKNDVYNHTNANDYFTPQSLDRFNNIPEGDSVKKSFKRLHRWRYSPTVAYGNNEVHLHPYKSRRLSVAESLAIQSLPAEYVFENNVTLSDKFKMIGNGVPYLLAKGIASSIKKFLDKNTLKSR